MSVTKKVVLGAIGVYVFLAILGMADTLWTLVVDSAKDGSLNPGSLNPTTPPAMTASLTIQGDRNQNIAYITLRTQPAEWTRWFRFTEFVNTNQASCSFFYEQFSRPYELQKENQQVIQSGQPLGHWESLRFRFTDGNQGGRPFVVVLHSWPAPNGNIDSCAGYPPPSSVIPPPPPPQWPAFSGTSYKFDIAAPTDEFGQLLNMRGVSLSSSACCRFRYTTTGKVAVLVNETEKKTDGPQEVYRAFYYMGPGIQSLRFRSLEEGPVIVHFTLESRQPDRISNIPVLDVLGEEYMVPFKLVLNPEKWSDYLNVPYNYSIEWRQEQELPFQATDGNGATLKTNSLDGSKKVRFIALTPAPIEIGIKLSRTPRRSRF